jgi:hypothetical protein
MVGVIVAREALLLHKSVVCLTAGQYSNCTVALFTAHTAGPTVAMVLIGVGEPQMGEV